jgi:hypothetical protein
MKLSEQDWRFWLDRDTYVACNSIELRVVHLEPGDGSAWRWKQTWLRRTLSDDVVLSVDTSSEDKNYWRSIRKFLLWLFAGKPFALVCYKKFRREHHESKRKEWDTVLPGKIVRWASNEIQREAKGLSCVDNARVARVGNTAQMRRYRMQKKHGCCGFADWQALGPDGEVYVLGFNFGH